jgi:hypothetical protein
VSVAVGDVNGDGNADLAVANGGRGTDTDVCHFRGGPAASVSVLLGNGGGVFLHEASYALLNDPCDVAIADLDGDSKPELVVPVSRSKAVAVMVNETG